MKCERCKENEATFFYEENINGEKKSVALCHDCAAAWEAKQKPIPSLFGGFGADLFDGFFGFSHGSLPKSGKTCEGCGAAWQDILSRGKAGCPKCYTTFAAEFEPTLRSIHGTVKHIGRAPVTHAPTETKETRLAALREKLKQAIEKEDFESAAALRDEIRAAQQE